MTLETCRLRLRVAKDKGDAEQIRIWEDRIAHRLTLPKYASESKEKSNGKKR